MTTDDTITEETDHGSGRTGSGACRILLYSQNGEIGSLPDEPGSGRMAITRVKSIRHVPRELLTAKYHLCLSRCDSFDADQRELLQLVRTHNVPTRVIVLARTGRVEDAVQAMKLGAEDFLVANEVNAQFIASCIESGLSCRVGPPAGGEIAGRPPADADDQLIGRSREIQNVRSAIMLVARSRAPVIITGESGTGKDIVARMVHLNSERKDQPFIALNCAALPRDVIENELFGHEKGAFTGALARKVGAFELAHQGTLFFDEIAEMNSDTQAKLLRAIENKSYRRLGGSGEVTVDVRVIAATNKNIQAALKSGEFREDLYYRFSVIEIALCPLRERQEDIPLLAEHFFSQLARRNGTPQQRFSDEALNLLMTYDWPGNVRELRNVVEWALLMCPDEVIGAGFLPPRISNFRLTGTNVTIPLGCSFAEAERLFILETLASVKNNKSEAARILGLSRGTLHNKMRQFWSRDNA